MAIISEISVAIPKLFTEYKSAASSFEKKRYLKNLSATNLNMPRLSPQKHCRLAKYYTTNSH